MKPAPLFIFFTLFWFLLGAGGFFSDQISLIWFLTGIILLPVIIIDGLVLYFLTDRLSVKREIPSSLAQGEAVKVKLKIMENEDSKFLPVKFLIWDIHPDSMGTEAFPASFSKHKNKTNFPIDFEYSINPIERGDWQFTGTELLLRSFLGFWHLKVFHDFKSQGRTYPNFKKIKAKAGFDLKGLLEKSGHKNIRMRGQGMEFSSLRDYQDGDSIRAADWRATSRKQKLIIREYQEEKDQQLLFLLDTGYRLHRQDGSKNQFDKALEAVLLLSWFSLKHGDSVGAASFGSENSGSGNIWLNPRKGLSMFPVLMNSLYNLSSSASPSSPLSVLEEALTRLKRRTFIILVSNFQKEDGDSMSWILKHVNKRHLMLFVNLNEEEAETIAARKPGDFDEALETSAAFSYLASRRQLYKTWEHSGILTMETSSEKLSGSLINRYLQVKRSGKL